MYWLNIIQRFLLQYAHDIKCYVDIVYTLNKWDEIAANLLIHLVLECLSKWLKVEWNNMSLGSLRRPKVSISAVKVIHNADDTVALEELTVMEVVRLRWWKTGQMVAAVVIDRS